MTYQLLSIFKYNGSGPSKSLAEVSQEYQRRLAGYSTVVTNLFPVLDRHEFDQLSTFPLFFIQTNEINTLINQVNRNSKKIIKLAHPLPGVAKHSYTRKLLTAEIYFTNEIEGVKTSRKQIGTIISELNSKKKSTRRLESAIRLYHTTLSGKTYQIQRLEDFRKIYDELLRGEIPESKQPDGHLFRNKAVYIGTESQKIHNPPVNEREIQQKLIPLINFMNDETILDIPKSLVTHFMFENTHPFYDGNGRMGRYLLSAYLASKLDPYTGLCISSAIHANQSVYYKIFKQTDDVENRADATLFITKLLAIISQGQQDVIESLSQLSVQLEKTAQKINAQFSDPIDQTILYIFAQSKLFSDRDETGIKDTELKEFLYADAPQKFHKRDLQRRIDQFEAAGILKRIKGKPVQHIITNTCI